LFFSLSAIGVGAVQANMAIFGAEQIREQKGTTQYFDKYYVAVNIGGLVAFGVIAYIQQNVNWFMGHLISTVLLGVTGILFLIGYRYYIHVKPYDSVITNFFPVLINAFQTWRKHRRRTRKIVYKRRSSNKITLLSDQDDINDNSPFDINERQISFLDYAKGANNGRFQDRVVDDIKSLRRIILLFLLLIPYWIIYLQVKSFSVEKHLMFRVFGFQSIFIYLD
jgi:peptide/histidine transporter 3/4